MCYIADTLLQELEPTLDPRAVQWISTLRDMQLDARSSGMLYLSAPDSAPGIRTYSLHMTNPVEPDPPSTGNGAPIVGAGVPPNAVPSRAQVLKPARLLVTPIVDPDELGPTRSQYVSSKIPPR